MTYDPLKHNRRSIRLKGYDYTQPEAYFVTLVAQNRECLFGEIAAGEMRINRIGRIVERCWRDIPTHFSGASLDGFVIMPNHLHGIILIQDCTGKASAAQGRKVSAGVEKREQEFPHLNRADASPQRPIGTQSGSLGAIIQNFKSVSTRKINQTPDSPGKKVWQRNYFERIVRNEGELNRIREYILNNPLQWDMDRENQHRL